VSRLIIYAGPNGAGKSTLRDIGDDPVDAVIDPDRIARELDPRSPSSVQVEAGRAAIQLFNHCLLSRTSMSLETTLTGATIIRRIRDAKDAGYEVSLRYVALSSVEFHIIRVEQRVLKGGHDIPTETLRRRYEASLNNLPKAVEHADNVTVMDNSGSERRGLFRAERGAIVELATRQPEWFSTRLPEIRESLSKYRSRYLPS